MNEESHKPDDMVLLRAEGRVSIVTLNYPRRRNAFCLAMRQQLYDRLHHLMHYEDRCRSIVLTGVEQNFCAGGDISEMQDRTTLGARLHSRLPLEVFKLMVSGPKPIVAAVEGVAMGAGLSLSAACDYIVTSKTARYCCAFGKVGLLPDTGLFWSLPQRVGGGKARELMLSSRVFDGQEALELGFANEAADPDKALPAALKVAECYAEMAPLALAHLKSTLATGVDTFDSAIETEINLQPLLRNSQDHQEAVAAFLEKRKPVFVGN